MSQLPIGAVGNQPTFSDNPKAFETYKLDIPVDFVYATSDGICKTKEGNVPYIAGAAIMTANGGSWPISAEKFAKTYDDMCNGTAKKKKIMVYLLKVDVLTEVKPSWGTAILIAQPNDYVAQGGPSDYWVVSESDYIATYAISVSEKTELAVKEFKALSDAYCYDREWWNSEFDVNQEYRAYVDEIINKYDLSQEVILNLFKREIILADNE